MSNGLDADLYPHHSKHQTEWGRTLVNVLDPEAGEAVLDVGCGDGRITNMIAELCYPGKVVGIDPSKGMISHAPTAENLTFQVLSAEEMDFQKDFNAVYSNAAFHWFSDQREAAVNMYHALRSGGRLCMQMGFTGNTKERVLVCDSLLQRPPFDEHIKEFVFPWKFLSNLTARSIFSDAGFKDLRLEHFPRPVAFDEQGFISWLRTGCLAYLEVIPKRLWNDFIEAIVNEFRTLGYTNERGEYVVTFHRLQIQGKRE